MKEDRDAVVCKIAEAASSRLEGLDFAIEPFGDGVSDAVLGVTDDVVQAIFDHPGNLA